MADGYISLDPDGTWMGEVWALKVQVQSRVSRADLLSKLQTAVTAAGGSYTSLVLTDYTATPVPSGIPGASEDPSGGRGPA